MSSAQSIFDIPPAIARVYAQRGYVPAQIEQAMARKARRLRMGSDGAPVLVDLQAVRASELEIQRALGFTVALHISSRLAVGAIKASELRAGAYASRARILYGRRLDFLAQEGPPIPAPKINDIIAEVGAHFRVSPIDIVSARRTAYVVVPRQIAMYICRELTMRSLPQIGERFGNRDHTTVLHAIKKISARVAADPEFAARVEFLKEKIGTRV
jgi:hypothetical protein